MPLTFGLEREMAPVSAEILWPSGKRESLTGLQPNQAYTIREGRGIIAQSKFKS